ncbi:fasciclin domain-containing protein [Novosphingobium malaysiense]|uniref:FAS1 domain-containing protein n=1 Tax=Novosphingobium malaysiense TaxID=1348853 RepID=A0A0B1ZTK4_9SPHN|nr:fasciclin domain-containing protein [Novosphingobium malaysiense]KHK92468.1 hypothetical protein LK12_06620 [Novosphingobium malaysiense]
MRLTYPTLVVLSASSLALAACSGGSTPSSDASLAPVQDLTPESQSVASALDNTDGLQTMAEALKETGIAGVFQGKGSYTLLAPEDDAFAALGDAGKELMASSDHAALAALIRDHILPGYLTPQDLGAAIDHSNNGQVTMATLSGDTLTFTRSDEGIVVTGSDGSQATLDGDPVASETSIAIPINGVLKKI